MHTKQDTLDFLLEDRIKLATVSGIFTTKPNLIERVDKEIPEIELITTKSYQVKPNNGNREPIITEIGVGSFANAVGLRNPGMEQGYKDLTELKKRHNLTSYLNVSVSGNSIDDFVALIKRFENIADIIELNFSCPNVPVGGSAIGSDVNLVKEYMKELRNITDALLFPKLTPNVADIGIIASAAVDNGADGLSGINTYNPEEYIEPHTGKTILYNPNGHIGGKSGEWIKETALQKISEMRKAIGEKIPIIGMGGVTTGKDVKNMYDAGANVVGIGSVFSRVRMKNRPKYIAALKNDAENGTNDADKFISKERLGEYKPHKIVKIDQRKNLRVFELDENIDYKASQFAYIWVPDVGEKPFSIAKNNPLTFVVGRREFNPEKKKGLVSNALFEAKEGDELMIRGVYGADAPDSEKPEAYIVAGGTGIAVVPGLAEKLYDQGKKIHIYHGISHESHIVLDDIFKQYGIYHPVIDNGTPGRVLHKMKNNLINSKNICFYNIGPVVFMKKAMEIEEETGADPKDVFSSLETNCMCGIGMCGECETGGKLVCDEGSFYSLDFLKSKNIDISEK